MKKTTFLDLQDSKKTQLQKQKQQEEKRKIIAKNTNVRALTNLKINMDKRQQQRSLALYYWTNNKFQSALIIGKQLMFSSQKVWRQFNDQFCSQFEQQYFLRTSKAREHLQYLLDSVLLCRIFIAAKKREDAVDILQKLELPQAPIVKQQNIKTNMDKILFNQAHQIYSKTCASLLSLIQITKQLKAHEYTQKMFSKYLTFVQKYYGKIQYGTALFKHGNYLYQNKMYQDAQNQYNKCIAIRKGNVYNGGLIDALVNSSICLRQLCDYQEAIQRMKSAIEINKDILNGQTNLDEYYLFLAKLYFQSGSFENAYHNFIYTYKLRQNLEKGNPKRVQIQLNLMFFYKTLRDINKNAQQCLNLTDKKQIQQKKKNAQQVADMMQKSILQREDFAKYKQFKSSKMAHLVLEVPKEFFDILNSNQVEELLKLKQKLTQLTFMRGKAQLSKCSFYKQKKTRDILIQANSALKQENKTKF